MARDVRPQREEKPPRPDRPAKPADFLTEFEEPPRWDWQAWVWLVFWVVALGSLLFGVVGGLLLEEGTNPVWILVGLVLSSGGGVLWARWRMGRKRTAAIASFARENGHAFKLAVKGKELEALPPFPLFRLGEKRRARNVVGGTVEGLPFVFMDYTYEASLKPVVQLAQLAGIELPDESTFPITQTVVAFPKLPRKLPAFRLVPLSLFKKSADRLGEAVKAIDLGPESDKTFVGCYAVEGEPADLMRRLFAPAIQAYLAADPKWYVECHDNQMVIFRSGRCCAPERTGQRLEKSLDILRVLTRTRPDAAAKGPNPSV